MRLFVAVWPTDAVLRVLSGAHPVAAAPELQWVRPSDWHVTLAFLGSVPRAEHDELVAALRSVGSWTWRCTATLGPTTSKLGSRVLCVPVAGLDGLAAAVRACSSAFNRSVDRDQPFVGHLTLARARRGRSVPGAAAGVPISSAWPVSEIRLVSSRTGQQGPEYSPTAFVALGD